MVWFGVFAAGEFWLSLWLQQNGLSWLGSIGVWLFVVAIIASSLAYKSWSAASVFGLLFALKVTVQSSAVFGQLMQWINALGAFERQVVAAHVAGIGLGAKALVLGLTDGDTSLLPQFLSDELKTLSLTHLNAVSGTNCSIVIALLLAVTSRLALARPWRILVAMLGLLSYLVLVGDQPSVLRAAVMSAVMLIGLLQGAKFRAVNLLAFGIVILLILQPDLASSLGLGLSAAATLGVLEFAPRLAEFFSRWLPNWFALMIAVALAAQVFCLPLLVSVQSNFGALGLVANMCAEPVVPFITVLGSLGALCCFLIPAIAPAFFWVASIGGQFLVVIAQNLSGLGLNIVWPGGGFGFVLALALLVAIFGYLSKSSALRRTAVFVAVGLALILLPQALSSLPFGRFPLSNWFYVACDVGQGDGTVIRSDGQVAVIDVGREPTKINVCLNQLGVHRINLLVLTHYDLDHVGGLAGAISGRKVDRALVTDFVDDRPGAYLSNQQLLRRGIEVDSVHVGNSGKLGSFDWLVLTPHAKGEGSIDANDGSISMYWNNKHVGIYTMADLPATGQRRILAERAQWWQPQYANVPTIMKVSHHGSADQEPAFFAWVRPDFATVSVGLGNPYGHPTAKALQLLTLYARSYARTDLLGSIAVSQAGNGTLRWGAQKRG